MLYYYYSTDGDGLKGSQLKKKNRLRRSILYAKYDNRIELMYYIVS